MNMRFIVSLFITLLFSLSSFAQDSSASPRTNEYWARLGAGIAGLDGHFGFGGTISLQYSSPVGLVGVRYVTSSRTGADPTTIGETRLTDISEISATWGLSMKFSFFHLSASTGIGIVWTNQKKLGGDENITRIGLPLEGEVSFRPLPVLGIGAVLSATVTPKNTVINPMIVFHIGKLR